MKQYKIVCIIAAIALIAIYIIWSVGRYPGALSGLAAVILFCGSITRSTQSGFVRPEFLKVKSTRRPIPAHIYIMLGLWVLLVDGVFLLWAYKSSPPGTGLAQMLANIWYNTIDANNYAEIAVHWYHAVEGSELVYKIVFFPLYPIVIRAIGFIVRSLPVAGMIVSGGCAYFGGLLLYRLMERISADSESATKSVLFYCAFPSAFFLMVPMTESLYVLLTIAFFYYLISGRYALAGAMGFFAALTRSQGILLFVPFIVELLIVEPLTAKKNGNYIIFIKKVVFSLGPVLGFCCYLLINFQIFGNPFQFMKYQQSHWGNSMTFFWNTPIYLFEYFQYYLANGQTRLAMGLSIPNLLAFWSGLIFIFAGAKKLPRSFTAYSLAYFAMSFGPTWLLSGPRYLCCLFTLACSAAFIKNKTLRIALASLYIIAFVIYLYFFINRYYVL